MTSDALYVFSWWLLFLVIGGIFTPFTAIIFRKFFDKGYIFSKILSVLILSYTVWILGSFRILPFAKPTLLIVLIGFFILNISLYKKFRPDIKSAFKWIIFEECIFLLTLAFWSFVRANEPSIHGLEKFMDFGFVNSILRSNYFPPTDMWLTKSPDYTGGFFINYYYYGQYILAFLTKFSGIDSAVTYNLMIATLFAYTFSLSFSLAGNLTHLYLLFRAKLENIPGVKKAAVSKYDRNTGRKPAGLKILIAGLLGAFLVSLGGNLHAIYTFTTGYPNESPVPFWTIPFGYTPDKYWYPNATRFIPFTIHEFPIYSFVVADLHGHVSDIPIVLFAVALLLVIALPKEKSAEPEKEQKENKNNTFLLSSLLEFEKNTSIPLFHLSLLGLSLSIMYMTNAWDGLIYMILSALVFVYVNFIRAKNIKELIYKTFSSLLFMVFFFLIFNLPFSLNFKPFVSGVGVLCAPKFLEGKTIGPLLFEKDHCQKSPIYMLIVLWGFFYYMVFGFFVFGLWPFIKTILINKRLTNESMRIKPQIYRNIFSRIFISIGKKISIIRELPPTDVFVIILVIISSLLLIFPEFFYMKDIYPAHYRANTMFKLGYQAFMMLGIVGGYTLMRIKHQFEGKRKNIFFLMFNFLFIMLFTLVAIYPSFAINSYYGALKNYQGLDGLKWMDNQYADDLKAIKWLNDNIKCNIGECNNQPVIAEANGESYTDYARVSAYTGLPTIIGWPVHEWLWRGSYDEAGKRIPEVATIYESEDVTLTKSVLKKYNVEYIFLGTLEKEKYPKLNTEKLLKLGKISFESGETKVIKVDTNNL